MGVNGLAVTYGLLINEQPIFWTSSKEEMILYLKKRGLYNGY